METDLIAAVASVVLAMASAFLGAKYRQWIGKARLFSELLGEIVAAAEDDEISEEEFHKIVAKAKQVTAELEG
jgi:hypothetical protein